MKADNLVKNSIKFVFRDLVGSLLYWPIWWYTTGFIMVAQTTMNNLKKEEETFGLRIWLVNLFRPMYGQYDWQGRLISFFMRSVILIFKLVLFLIWSAVSLALIILWLILPIVAIYQIVKNFYYFFEYG